MRVGAGPTENLPGAQGTPLHPGLRRFYLASAWFTLAGGVTPFVLSDRAEDLFACPSNPR